jgi:hypothetical protein
LLTSSPGRPTIKSAWTWTPVSARSQRKFSSSLGVILSPADEFGDFLVERLDADLELERAGRKLADDFAQRLRQAVGNHLEMHEQAGPMALEKEPQDGRLVARLRLKVRSTNLNWLQRRGRA